MEQSYSVRIKTMQSQRKQVSRLFCRSHLFVLAMSRCGLQTNAFLEKAGPRDPKLSVSKEVKRLCLT